MEWRSKHAEAVEESNVIYRKFGDQEHQRFLSSIDTKRPIHSGPMRRTSAKINRFYQSLIVHIKESDLKTPSSPQERETFVYPKEPNPKNLGSISKVDHHKTFIVLFEMDGGETTSSEYGPFVSENTQKVKSVFQVDNEPSSGSITLIDNEVIQSALNNQQFISESKKWGMVRSTMYGMTTEINVYWEIEDTVMFNTWKHTIKRKF